MIFSLCNDFAQFEKLCVATIYFKLKVHIKSKFLSKSKYIHLEEYLYSHKTLFLSYLVLNVHGIR